MALGDNSLEVDNTLTYSPESLKAKRRLAEAMLKAGMETTPIQSHWQGLARLANAMIGGYKMSQLDQQDAAANKQGTDFQSAMRGLGPSTAPSLTGTPGPGPLSGSTGDNSSPAAGSPDYTNWLKKREGFSAKPYSDYKQTSIGYGTRAQPGETSITPQEAEKRLGVEVGQARQLVQSWAKDNGITLSPKQEEAFADLTYNSGTKWQTQGIAAAAKAGNWQLASDLFKQYNKAGGQTLPGLVERRKALAANLMDTSAPTAAMPGPVQVAVAGGGIPQIPGITVDTPPVNQAMQPNAPDLSQGAPPAAVPPQAATQVAPQLNSPAASPQAGPQVAAPSMSVNPVQVTANGQPVAPAPVTKVDVQSEVWKSFGDRAPVIAAGMRSPHPAIRDAATKAYDDAVGRVMAAQMPAEPLKQAELADKLASAQKHQVEAELARRDMKLSKDDMATKLQGAVENLAQVPHEYGRQATERAIGPYSGANINENEGGWVGSIVNAVPTAVAKLRGEVAAMYEGGAPPSEVRRRIEGDTQVLVNIMKPFIRQKGEGSQSNYELQQLQQSIGQVIQSRTVEEYNRGIEDLRHRIGGMIGQEVAPVKEQKRSAASPKHAEEITTGMESMMDVIPDGSVAKTAIEKLLYGGLGIPARPLQPQAPSTGDPQRDALLRALMNQGGQ